MNFRCSLIFFIIPWCKRTGKILCIRALKKFININDLALFLLLDKFLHVYYIYIFSFPLSLSLYIYIYIYILFLLICIYIILFLSRSLAQYTHTHTLIFISMYLPNPSVTDTRSNFNRSKTELNSFSQTGCLPKAKDLNLSNYLSMAERRTNELIPFLRV